MDPDTALKSAREHMSAACMTDDDEIKEWALTEMMESFAALDGWLSKGGFLPIEWDRPRVRRAADRQGRDGHDPLCPVQRETWCVWPGDKCSRCDLIARVRTEERRAGYEKAVEDACALLEEHVNSRGWIALTGMTIREEGS